MKKLIKKHRDQDFAYGMSRYFCGGLVVDSDSWEALFEKIKKYDCSSFRIQSFNEYKLFNLTILIEYQLADILELFFKEDKIDKEKTYNCILDICKRYRKLDQSKAETILKKEIGNNQSNLFSPHILFYIAGCGLGDIFNIFDQYKVKFLQKDRIVKQLRGFKYKRNDFTHNLLSSRSSQHKLLSRALLTGLKLKKTFDQMVKSDFISSISGREMISKLKI